MPTRPKSAAQFRKRSELLDFLLEVSTLTSETLDLDRLLASVAEIVKKVIPYELLAIMLYSEKAKGLKIRYAIGHREEVVQNLVIKLGEGLTGTAALTRKPVLVGDVRTDPRYLNVVDAVRSELAVPMVFRNKLVGVIDVQSTRLNAYREYERSILTLIANRIASTIDNARLYLRLKRQNSVLRTLTRISQEFAAILELDELLEKIATTVRSMIQYDSFSVLLVDEQQQLLRHRFSSRYDERTRIDNVPLGMGITGAVVQARQTIRVDDTLNDPRYIPSHPDIRSEVAVPLIVHDRVVGVMDLESEQIAFFTEDHVRTLSLLAPQIAASVENARLYEEVALREQRLEADLAAARELQSVLLLVEPPEVEGLDVAVGHRPAREISGDLYDFFPYRQEQVLFAFGDVSGKGAAAALYGAMVGGLLHILARRRYAPSQLMMNLNETLVERKVDAQFVALLILLWDHRTREVRMANAGAVPPMICRSGQIILPRVEGVPLGLLEHREYEETCFQAAPGDLILLYSDGISDQQNSAGVDYGRSRLATLIRKFWLDPPQSIVNKIFADLDEYTGGATPSDDQTLLVMKVL